VIDEKGDGCFSSIDEAFRCDSGFRVTCALNKVEMSFRIECSRSEAREEIHSTIPRINKELCISVDIGA